MKPHLWILICFVWFAAYAEAEETGAECIAQLSEDTTVELVGIRPYSSGHPQRTKGESGPWWSPDGTPLLMPPDKRFDSCSWSDSYLFVIAVEGKTDCDFKAIGPWDHDLTIAPTRDWEKENNIPFPVGMIRGDIERTRFTWGVRSLPRLILANNKHSVTSQGFAMEELQDELRKTGDKQ